MDKLNIACPIAVEGKYDREKVMRVADAVIITTDGFAVFNSEEKKQLIRRLADKSGIIILTDSDGAGLVIRNYFKSILPKDKLINLYIPQIGGKEKRKSAPSKAGYLGVEGMEDGLLYELLKPYSSDAKPVPAKEKLTKADMYMLGLSGRDNSSALRDEICARCGLPSGMSPTALMEALSLLYGRSGTFELFE